MGTGRCAAVRAGAEQAAQLGAGPAPLALDDGNAGAVAGRGAVNEHGAAVREPADPGTPRGDPPDLDDGFRAIRHGGGHRGSSCTCGASATTLQVRMP